MPLKRIWNKKNAMKFAKAINKVTIFMPDCEEKRKADTLALEIITDWKSTTEREGFLYQVTEAIHSLNEWAINKGLDRGPDGLAK